MADKGQMLELRKRGLTHKEIAEICGCSRQYAATICAYSNPAYYRPIGDECIYPNLANWMNRHKVSRREFLKRMGLEAHSRNYERFTSYLRGDTNPRKQYIDKMLAITGMTYEEMFYTEAKDG
jgi:transcriptional regulator with XRE-family HTH domain